MRLLPPELLRPADEAFRPVCAEYYDMLISAVVVSLVIGLMAVLVVRSLLLRASIGRPAAPKRARKKPPAPRNLHLVVNKNDMDRELAALLGKERARPPDPDGR